MRIFALEIICVGFKQPLLPLHGLEVRRGLIVTYRIGVVKGVEQVRGVLIVEAVTREGVLDRREEVLQLRQRLIFSKGLRAVRRHKAKRLVPIRIQRIRFN